MPSIEQQIEYLCSCEFSDYVSLKNQCRLEGGVTPSRRPLLRSLSEIEAEQDEMARRKRRFHEFENYKNDMRAKTPAEIDALVAQKKAETANRQQQELLARIVAEKEKFWPDWSFWLHMPDVELWQACALSIGIDPDKMKVEPNSWLAGPGTDHGPFFTLTSFPSKAVEDDFNKRLRLAKAHHGASARKRVPLSMFVTWALPVPLFKDMPDELTAFTGSKLPPTLTGGASASPQTAPGSGSARNADGTWNRDALLAEWLALKNAGSKSPTKDLAKKYNVSETAIKKQKGAAANNKPEPPKPSASWLSPLGKGK